MKIPAIVLAGIFLLACSSNLSAQGSKEIWKKLNEAMQHEIDAPQLDGAGAGPERTREAKRAVATNLRAALASSDDTYPAESTLVQLDDHFQSPEVLRLAEELRAALHKERDAIIASASERIGTALKHAADAVRAAKEPRNLDAILPELKELSNMQTFGSLELRNAITQLQDTRQFVFRWQDYLSAAQVDDPKHAIEILRALTTPDYRIELMPRSDILALIEQKKREIESRPLQSLEEILGKAETLDDVAPVMKELHSLEMRRQQTPSGANVDEVRQAINALMQIDRTYREVVAGLPPNLAAALNQSDHSSARIASLRVQLLMLMLPRFLSLPPEIKSEPGEAVLPFIERIVTLARDRGDTALFARARDAKRILSHGNQTSEAGGMAAFSAGQNQEAAGQYVQAVISYKRTR